MKPTRILLVSGLALLLVGVILQWNAEVFSRHYIPVNGGGKAWTIDKNRKEGIGFVGDRLSLLGVGFLLIGTFGWMNTQREAGPTTFTAPQ